MCAGRRGPQVRLGEVWMLGPETADRPRNSLRAITTVCLSRINHLGISLCPSIIHCGQEGIRFAHYPKLASFRISRGPAATARFRAPGVPIRQSAHFGFVPPSAQGGQRRPAIAASSVALSPLLSTSAGVFRPPGHPGDASCQKTPSDASPNLGQPPQPIEKEELITP